MPIIQAAPVSLADIQKDEKAVIVARILIDFRSLKTTWNDLFRSIWFNRKLTPQQVFDAFGRDSGDLFRLCTAMSTAINTISPGSVDPTPPVDCALNSDGTVTVG